VPGELQSEVSICVEQLQPYDTLFPQFKDECYHAEKRICLINKFGLYLTTNPVLDRNFLLRLMHISYEMHERLSKTNHRVPPFYLKFNTR